MAASVPVFAFSPHRDRYLLTAVSASSTGIILQRYRNIGVSVIRRIGTVPYNRHHTGTGTGHTGTAHGTDRGSGLDSHLTRLGLGLTGIGFRTSGARYRYWYWYHTGTGASYWLLVLVLVLVTRYWHHIILVVILEY
jgi:hypothetical protein